MLELITFGLRSFVLVGAMLQIALIPFTVGYSEEVSFSNKSMTLNNFLIDFFSHIFNSFRVHTLTYVKALLLQLYLHLFLFLLDFKIKKNIFRYYIKKKVSYF